MRRCGRLAGVRLGGPETFFLPFVRARTGVLVSDGLVSLVLPEDSSAITIESALNPCEDSIKPPLLKGNVLHQSGRNMGHGLSLLWRDGKRIRDGNGARYV